MMDLGRGTATAINNSGQIVGILAGSHAGLWQDGDVIDLHRLVSIGGAFSSAFGVNNLGDVVGDTSLPGSTFPHAFLLYNDGVAKDLGTLPGHTYSTAYAVNDLRQVVGGSTYCPEDDCSQGREEHVFLWEDGKMTGLGIGRPSGINNLGQIVGGGRLWTDGAWYSLGDLIGPDPVGITVSPAFINDAGQIAANGTAELVPGRIRFASWLLTPIKQGQ
jgi:probable HAF family extracellular repeat protein